MPYQYLYLYLYLFSKARDTYGYYVYKDEKGNKYEITNASEKSEEGYNWPNKEYLGYKIKIL